MRYEKLQPVHFYLPRKERKKKDKISMEWNIIESKSVMK